MSTDSRLFQQIKKHEGFSSTVYKCSADKLTIGYGRNIEDRGITKAEAEYLLANDIEIATEEAEQFFDMCKLNEARKSVIINMLFNLGMSRFATFKKFISAINEGQFTRAAHEMVQSRWYRQVGRRGADLVEQMLTGEFQ